MCIFAVSKSKESEWKQKQPDTIVMWKVLRRDLTSPLAGRNWYTGTQFQYKYGKNKAPESKSLGVDSKGFHVFLTRLEARRFREWGEIVRKVLVKKKDIVAIGNDYENVIKLRDAVVTELMLLTPKESRQHGNL